MNRLPTLDETIAELTKTTKVATAPSFDRVEGLRKIAEALRSLPSAEPSYDDLYTVKVALYGV